MRTHPVFYVGLLKRYSDFTEDQYPSPHLLVALGVNKIVLHELTVPKRLHPQRIARVETFHPTTFLRPRHTLSVDGRFKLLVLLAQHRIHVLVVVALRDKLALQRVRHIRLNTS